MRKVKIGIIGTGSISAAHLNAYMKNPYAEIVALCDINKERLNQKAEQYNVKNIFTSADEMVKSAELDAVSICTWNNAHAPTAIAALNAGLHVLCEKPMALNTEQALAMQNAAKKNEKLLMIGFTRRFDSDTAILQKFIDSGQLGELYYLKASYLRRHGSPGGWFGDFSRSGGGPLIDLGVHIIDLCRYLMGNPKPVSVYGATFNHLKNRPKIQTEVAYKSADANENDIFDVEDLAVAMIRFDNGALMTVETSFSLNIKQNKGSVELFGTKGGAKLMPELEIYTDNCGHLIDIGFNEPTALSFSSLFQKEIDHFIDCVRGTAHCRAPMEDGVTLMTILDAIYESAKIGHEIIL